ncbi:MAG: hypothetical protein H0V51_25665 [Chloroflexi bacterium]|nr:hypothetical protein [Chloroflexota bacterium]
MNASSKAFEMTGTIDAEQQLHLDERLPIAGPSRVRVIILVPEQTDLDAPGERSKVLPADERRRRLREADAELRKVGDRLEALLRARHPDLFDRRGRFRGTELARRLTERAGGKKTLSGDELRALEERTDAEAARSASAP